MTETLNIFLLNFSDIIEHLDLLLFALGMLGIFAFKGYDRDDPVNSKKLVKFGIICITPIILFTISSLIANFIIDIRSRNHLKAFLLKNELIIKVNDRTIPKDSILIYSNQLTNVKSFNSHHSSPRYGLKIDLISLKDTLSIILRQDSEIKTEYRIYWAKDKTNDGKDFGCINSNIFQEEELIIPEEK